MKPQGIAEWTHREMETLIYSVARYTKFVRSTKVVLSVLAGLLTCIVLFYPILVKDNGGVRIAFTSIEKTAASPTQMVNAKFHGLDKDNQPFNVTASTAIQKDDNTLVLDKVGADIMLNSGSWLSMVSDKGTLLLKEKLLYLQGSIDMFNDEGYEFRTDKLDVDIAAKTAVTHQPVDGQGPLGTLKATGAIVNEKDQVIYFEGPVHVTLYMNHPGDKTQGKNK